MAVSKRTTPPSSPRQSVTGRRAVKNALVLVFLVSMNAVFQNRSSMLKTLVKLQGQVTTSSSSSSSASSSSSNELVKTTRMDKYYSRYKYKPPDSPPSYNADLCGSPPAYDTFFASKGDERSRFAEDQKMWNYLFQNVSNGIYIELGAFDGKTESNTRFFDECLGWQGLLLEGNPVKYDQLVANRPHAHRMSMAPSCEDDNATVQFHAVLWTNAGLEGQANDYKDRPTVDVPCGPLQPILDDIFGTQRVSFFSLDVEGAERSVLKTLGTLKDANIDVFMIESWNNHCREVCPARDEIRATMQASGYTRYDKAIPASDVYVHPHSKFQMPAGMKPAAVGATV